MATVRFSKELSRRIEKAARAKMQPAVQRARDQNLDNAWGQRIYDILFGDVILAINTLPDGWIRKVEKISVVMVAGRACNMEFTFATPQPWPHQFPDTEMARKEYSYGDSIVLKDHLVWGEFLAEVTDYTNRVQAAEQRRDEFIVMVKKICNTYSTLAPALKAWPPLWELVPEDVKDKHREIKVREKTEVKLDVDLNKLTALSTAAKFGL